MILEKSKLTTTLRIGNTWWSKGGSRRQRPKHRSVLGPVWARVCLVQWDYGWGEGRCLGRLPGLVSWRKSLCPNCLELQILGASALHP